MIKYAIAYYIGDESVLEIGLCKTEGELLKIVENRQKCYELISWQSIDTINMHI